VRGCACRGTAGFVHVSCLAEQAKILCDEAEENNLDIKAKNERFRRWQECSLCEQTYHGGVKCALGWACWKTYLGRPEGDRFRIWAMGTLGQSMRMVGHVREATVVLEALLALIDRQPEKEKHTHTVLNVQNTLASLYGQQGRHEEELSLRRKNYPLLKLIEGANSQNALISANNLGLCLHQRGRHAAAREALREPLADARRTFGEDHSITLNLRETTADATSGLGGEANLRETIAIYEDLVTRSRRVLGTSHPTTQQREQCLREFRAFLTGGVAAVLAERRARGGGGGA